MQLLFYSEKRLIGYDCESDQFTADKLRHYLFGGHVADYMKRLADEDEERYKIQFSEYIKQGLAGDAVSDYLPSHILLLLLLDC